MKSPLIRLVIALIVCAAAFGGYGFWYAAVSAKSADVANLESQIATALETASRVASVRAALAKLVGDETAVQNYFVSETSIVSFINDLETRGRSQGAAVSVLSVSSGGESGRPALVFSITVEGTFDGVMRTVGMVEYAPFAISISELSVGKGAENGWHANLKLKVGSMPVRTATNSNGSASTKPTTP